MSSLGPQFISAVYPGTLKGNILKLDVSSKGIETVNNLAAYRNLARLDLSKNRIERIEGLSGNLGLTWLSVAGNTIQSLEDVLPLKKLQVLNAGNNALSGTVELGSLASIKALILNNNRITKLKGLSDMPELNTLVISHNRIKKLGKMLWGCSSLSKLSMTHNRVEDIEDGLKDCTRLFELKVGHNELERLPESFSLCYRLRVLDLAGNRIESTSSIQVLQKLKFLRHLTLKGNPICSKEGYRDTISTMLPNLESLDGKKIEGRSRGNHKQQPEPEAAGSGKGQMARDRGAQEPAGKRRKAEVVKKRETEAKDADEGDDRDNSSDDDVIDAADLGLGAASREVQDDTGSGAFLEEVLDDPDGDRHGAPAAGKAAHTGIVGVTYNKSKKKQGRQPKAAAKPSCGLSAVEMLLSRGHDPMQGAEVGIGVASAWGDGASAWDEPQPSNWGKGSETNSAPRDDVGIAAGVADPKRHKPREGSRPSRKAEKGKGGVCKVKGKPKQDKTKSKNSKTI